MWRVGVIAYKTGRFKDAAKFFRKALRLGKEEMADHETVGTTLCNLARALLKLGQCEEAIACYRKVRPGVTMMAPLPYFCGCSGADGSTGRRRTLHRGLAPGQTRSICLGMNRFNCAAHTHSVQLLATARTLSVLVRLTGCWSQHVSQT